MKWLRKLIGGGGVIKQLDHAAIVVSDMDKAFDFYSGVLGLDIIVDGRAEGGEKKSFLGVKKHALIALTEDKGRTSSATTEPVHHIAFRVGDLQKSSLILQEKGVNFIEEKRDSQGRVTAYHFLDPDGLELEICEASEEVPTY